MLLTPEDPRITWLTFNVILSGHSTQHCCYHTKVMQLQRFLAAKISASYSFDISVIDTIPGWKGLKDHVVQPFLPKAEAGQGGRAPCPAES